ncbi:ATP-dependent RecD-like DNA helicase [Pseudoalteromonas sp. MB41]|uniref:AAA family ATPase n=1 Tax=Pseudoalteromonas sp. MB41 TaxID=2896366 RepID=UPI001E44C099|nr:AAA family ATPase [Pseudoalteromonas sp. MB41]MCC9661467.1 ATP-dependent RecD-like DNA helicase [Pseudoalteromonas sp. MB41]
MSIIKTEVIRVTNVYQSDETYVSFSGVPLSVQAKKNRQNKKIIFIKTPSSCVPIEPSLGQHWKVTGNVETRKFTSENNFKITQDHYVKPEKIEIVLPTTAEHFALFIGKNPSFRGISQSKAKEVWDTFGNEIYQILDDRNDERLKEILSKAKINTLVSGYRQYSNLKYTTWFSELGIPLHVQQRLIKYHDHESIIQLKDNPYLLTKLGMKFNAVDSIAQERFSIENDDIRRIISAFEQALKRHERQGHTVAHRADLKPKLQKLLKSETLASESFQRVLKASTDKVLVYNKELETYQSTACFIKEKAIALRIKYLVNLELSEYERNRAKAAFRHALSSVSFKLTLGQCRAVYKALRNKVCVVSGGAGTGKTTVLKAILAGYEILGITSHCAALSGRAAKRLQESTEQVSMTITRLLMKKPIEPDLIDSSKQNALVLDESSMIDITTMFKLINHIHPDTRILFVGDPKQLPPIDSGLVLNDIINSHRVAISWLDIVKRHDEDTGIPEYSLSISNGVLPPSLTTGNITFHCVADNEINQKCLELYKLNTSDSRITSAVYKKEYGGIDSLNRLLQGELNSLNEHLTFVLMGQTHKLPIKRGDPVIFTKNNIDSGVQNGTLGTLISLATKNHLGEVLIDASDDVIKLNHELLNTIEPAYSISLHKAQGSQFRRVIIPLNGSNLIDRNWLYTAITRAEVEAHLVGPKSFFEKAIHKEGATEKRKTGLRYILNSLF